jgi:hypothetical protein
MKPNSIISQVSFATIKREKLLNYNTYAAEAEDLISRIPKAEKRLSDPAWLADKDTATLVRMTAARAGYALNLIALQYSAGAPLAELRTLFVAVVDYFEIYAKYDAAYNAQQGEGYKSPHIALGDSEFNDANRLVCFAILLGLESLLGRIAAIIDFDCSAPDGMLERLLAVYLDGRTRPNECTRHLPYFKTLKIFDTASPERESLMADYLADWYTASRREPYFESHKRGEEFRGYWSWEAGAITVALGIDDTTFRDAAFYPRDLVDFARQARQMYSPAGLPEAEINELRAKAGDPCPKAGTWLSLDVESTRRRFEFEQQMPDLHSAYGLTVWRYLDGADNN